MINIRKGISSELYMIKQMGLIYVLMELVDMLLVIVLEVMERKKFAFMIPCIQCSILIMMDKKVAYITH